MSLELLLIDKTFNISLLFVIDMIAVWLSFWVYFTNPKSFVNRLFFLFSLSILTWVNAAYFFTFSKSLSQALFWAKIGIGGVFPFLVFFYLFSTYFLSKKKRLILLDKLFLGLGFSLFSLTLFTSSIVKGAEFTHWGADIIFTSYGRIIFYGMVLLFTVLSIAKLFKNYFKFSKEERVKAQYLLLGLVIFVLMNLVFNVFLPIWRESIQYWQFGNYSAIFLLGFGAYAIVKKELFEIKVILTQLLVGLIAILLLVNVIVSETPFEYIWKGILFLTFLVFGYLLIRSVLQEIRYREQIERSLILEEKAKKELKKPTGN